MCSGFELEEDDEACTSIKKANRVHGEGWRTIGPKYDRVGIPSPINDIKRVAFSGRYRSKQIPSDRELVGKRFNYNII